MEGTRYVVESPDKDFDWEDALEEVGEEVKSKVGNDSESESKVIGVQNFEVNNDGEKELAEAKTAGEKTQNPLSQSIRRLLSKQIPSQLDEQLQTTCPYYKPDKNITSVYGAIHDIAKSRILTKLQVKLDELAFRGEVELSYGRVDGGASKTLLTDGKGDYIAFIEVKSGNVKLAQPAAYTYLTNTRTLIVEVKTGSVFTMDVRTAERILEEAVAHLEDKERLRESGQKLPGAECRYCRRDCKNKEPNEFKRRPLKRLPMIMDNIDTVTTELVDAIEEIVAEGR